MSFPVGAGTARELSDALAAHHIVSDAGAASFMKLQADIIVKDAPPVPVQ
jgi:hypothetical protein